MRVVGITSARSGLASRCVPALVASPSLELGAIIVCERNTAGRGRLLKRRLKKTRRIGILGALNGIRIRKWFADPAVEDIAEVCAAHGVPLLEIPVLNSPELREALRDLAPDVAISLGNGYIGASVFTIPPRGMINVHCELLPEFQNAQSVIWPIHEGRTRTGVTIHCVDQHIDTGNILDRRERPIQFFPSLRETVEYNVRRSYAAVPEAVVDVCENLEARIERARPQGQGGRFTTPSFRQFLRMVRNNQRSYRAGAGAAAEQG